MNLEYLDNEDDDESMSNGDTKKRTRDGDRGDADDKKNRGNYRCSKCNLPKKGHVCPYQPRFRRRDQPIEGAALDAEIQCELDADMTVRMLPLDRQGFPESYMAVNTALLHHQYSGNVPPGVIEGAPFCDGLNASDRGIFHGSTSNVSALPVPTTLSTESISPTSEMGAT